MYEKDYDSYTDVPVNTLKLKLKVCNLTPNSSFHFKYTVPEYKADTTKHVSLS